jgi:DNA end-binding protein Ku
MAARAMWKGVVRIGRSRVPVKLFAAARDRSVRFRLLERATRQPVIQQLVNPETDEVVPFGATRRGFVLDDELVLLEPDELARLEPEPSRDIEVAQFVPHAALDHRWYVRPYYLGPDGEPERYAALAAALDQEGLEGIAHWTMRKKAYVGALRLHRGYPMLVTLRPSEEVLPIEQVERPAGKPLDERQLDMARQLVAMLEAPFEPEAYRDEYRERVERLIDDKRKGEEPARRPPPRRKRPAPDLERALRDSLRAAGSRG